MIQGRDLLQLKIVKQQYRGSVKRASDLKMKTELYRVSLKILYKLHSLLLPQSQFSKLSYEF